MSKIVSLTLTYYKTRADYERQTGMLEPYDPSDLKKINVSFIKEESVWVLQQPADFKFNRISNPNKILKMLNEYNPNFSCNTLKIKKNYYPTFDEFTYEE